MIEKCVVYCKRKKKILERNMNEIKVFAKSDANAKKFDRENNRVNIVFMIFYMIVFFLLGFLDSSIFPKEYSEFIEIRGILALIGILSTCLYYIRIIKSEMILFIPYYFTLIFSAIAFNYIHSAFCLSGWSFQVVVWQFLFPAFFLTTRYKLAIVPSILFAIVFSNSLNPFIIHEFFVSNGHMLLFAGLVTPFVYIFRYYSLYKHFLLRIEVEKQNETLNITNVKITKQKKELEVAKESAEAANRSKSIFLANMSHEIRTPMNAILGFTQIILRDPLITSKQKQQLQTVNTSGEHLLALINDILEMSKIEVGKITVNSSEFDVYEFIKEIEAMFRLRTDIKNLNFIVETEDLPRYLITDENKLRQTFINLLGNAIKFTEYGGIAWRIQCVKEGDSMYLRSDIEDSGLGIAKEQIDLLFNAFVQTESGTKVGGTGLGLAISKKFANLLEGDITVKSEKGTGSCFSLKIKVKEGTGVAPKNAINKRNIIGIKSDFNKNKVLIVDDKFKNREVLKGMLSFLNFNIDEAVNGRDAIIKAEQWKPDIILMDMRMPIMDGYEAISVIKANDKIKNIPIVAVTASAFDEERKKILELGVDDFLRKPFKDYEVYNSIGKCLGIEYIYEDEEIKQEMMAEITSNDLKIFTEEFLNELKEATMTADFAKLMELIDRSSETSKEIAVKLHEFASNYQYDELIELLE